MRRLIDQWNARRLQRRADYLRSQEETDFFSWEVFDRVQERCTRAFLLQRFYEWNNFEDDMRPWIAMVIDPEGFIQKFEHAWLFVHYQDYFVKVELNETSQHGIHRAILYYKTCDGGVLRLAVYQFGPVFFWDQDAIIQEYAEVLMFRKWYLPESDRNKIEAYTNHMPPRKVPKNITLKP